MLLLDSRLIYAKMLHISPRLWSVYPERYIKYSLADISDGTSMEAIVVIRQWGYVSKGIVIPKTIVKELKLRRNQRIIAEFRLIERKLKTVEPKTVEQTIPTEVTA